MNTLDTTLHPVNTLAQVTAATQGDADVIVVGGGISGLTAGMYASRAGYRTVVLEGTLMSSVDYPGGQLMLTPEIENYPGFATGSGADLIDVVRSQAIRSGARVEEGRVSELTLCTSGDTHGLHRLVTDEGAAYAAPKLIIATGAIARRLNIAGEAEFYGKGVSSCATCDGAFFAGKPVAVVGGGDVAVEDALYMTKHASHVFLVHRRDELRSTSPQARALLDHPKVTVLWGSQVARVSGDSKVQEVTVVSENGSYSLPVNALFVAIGHDPQSELLKGLDVVEVDDFGYVKVDGVKTSIPGLFVAGDVADPVYRQAVTAAASGAMSAMEATKELAARSA